MALLYARVCGLPSGVLWCKAFFSSKVELFPFGVLQFTEQELLNVLHRGQSCSWRKYSPVKQGTIIPPTLIHTQGLATVEYTDGEIG